MKETAKRFLKKAATVLMSFAIILSFCACGNGGGNTPEDEPDLTETALAEYASLPEIRFSSFYGSEESDECRLKMRVPFDDEFAVGFTESGAKSVTIFGGDGSRLVSSSEGFEIELKKDDLVYVKIVPVRGKIKVNVTAKKNLSQLPFEVEGAPDTTEYDTTSTEGDPLVSAELKPEFRDHGLYIISSSPETLEQDCLNIAFTRHDVSDEEVFFTFEHNTGHLTSSVYYGYQVLNNGTEDAYVTVKNVGMQVAGPGAYYGESAWTSFYNRSFEMPDMSKWTEGEKKNFDTWFGFSGNARSTDFQPVTYRIPAGKYIYALGGTTKDAFNNYNVGNTANKLVRGSVQNGVVLFEVVGKAEGIFYVYDDPGKVGVSNKTPGEDQSKDENGNSLVTLNGLNYGAVVEMKAEWTFNDETPAQPLPVAFTNYVTSKPKGEPYGEVEYSPREIVSTRWYTHCNSHFKTDALGVDMIALHTTCGGKPVTVSLYNYDFKGELPNMGNWMVEYIDTYTFVNRGDREREITVKVGSSFGGCLAVIARDEHGDYIEGSAKFAMVYKNTEYGDPLDYPATYVFTVPAHSVKQMSLEFNLLANSLGTVLHSVSLG